MFPFAVESFFNEVIKLFSLKTETMKQILLLGIAAFMALPIFAQRSYVHRAIERDIERKNEEKYGEPGKSKFNTWADNVNDAPVRDKYAFTQSMTYQHKKYRNGKETETNESVIYANAKESLVAAKMDDKRKGMMVLDMKSRVQMIFDNEKMTYMAINQNAFMSRRMQEEANAGKASNVMTNLKATGKTKTILGYTCKQFQKLNDEGKVVDEYWVATLADFKGINFLNPNAALNEGVVLESISFRNGQMVSSFTATAINKSENFTIDPKKYNRNSMEHMH